MGIGPVDAGWTSIGDAAVTGATIMFEADTASRVLGIDLVDLGDHRATVSMIVRPDMVNGHGIAHGGFIFLLADTAFSCACNEPGSVTVAAGAEITFLAPARRGDLLTATAERRSSRGRSGIYDVTVFRAGPGPGNAVGTANTGSATGRVVIAEFRGRSRRLSVPGASGSGRSSGPDQSKPDKTKPDETKPDETKPDETKPNGLKQDEPTGKPSTRSTP